MLAHHHQQNLHPPVQPCLRRIHGGSELHRRGLSNQTTHAKANGEEKDSDMGVCCLTSNALQGSEEEEGFWCGSFFVCVQYVVSTCVEICAVGRRVIEQEEEELLREEER